MKIQKKNNQKTVKKKSKVNSNIGRYFKTVVKAIIQTNFLCQLE